MIHLSCDVELGISGSNGRVCVSRGTSGNEDNLVQLLRTSGLSADEAVVFLKKVEGGFKGGVSVSVGVICRARPCPRCGPRFVQLIMATLLITCVLAFMAVGVRTSNR